MSARRIKMAALRRIRMTTSFPGGGSPAAPMAAEPGLSESHGARIRGIKPRKSDLASLPRRVAMKDGGKNDPEARLAMVLFLHLGGWRTHAQLANAVGIARSQVSEYFEGKRPIPRQALEKVAAASG